MKETFIINSHIYKNAAVSMQPRRFCLSFERGRLYELPFLMLFTQGKKFKNPVSKDNPPCKTPIIDW